MQQTLISVIIPSYNHQSFIGAAIDSVLQQTHQHLELIVIDDHSSDQSIQTISQYDDLRLQFNQHSINIGSSGTINEGICKAKGDYIAILNSDDIFLPNRLERLLEVAQRESADFVATNVELINKEGSIIRDKNHWWIQWVDGLRALYSTSGDIVQALFSGNFFISTSNFFIKREVFNRIGLFNNYRYTSDYEFILRYLADNQNHIVYLFDEKLLQYRLHDYNTILESRIAPGQETFQVLGRWLPEFLQQPIDRQRSYAMHCQLEKVAGYIIDATLQPKQQEIEALHHALRAKDFDLNKLNELNYQKDMQIQQMQANRDLMQQALNHQIENLMQSNSYKLGQLIFRPLSRLRNLLQ